MPAENCRLEIRLQPGSSRAEVVGVDAEGRLRVRVRESPVDGQANRALLKLLADRLGVPRSALRIASGLKSRNKTVELAGFDRDSAMWVLIGER